MRRYKEVLQKYLRESICGYREKKGYSQEKMAEKLHESTRSYIEQEHGRYGFSAWTLLFYLLMLSEKEVEVFLQEFRKRVEKEEKREEVA